MENKIYKVYETNCDNGIQEGAVVTTKKLKCGVEIPCILVGEEGRGRKLGVLPVKTFEEINNNEEKVIKYAEIGTTQKGHPKLIETNESNLDGVILVLRTPIGHRGSNSIGLQLKEREAIYDEKKGKLICMCQHSPTLPPWGTIPENIKSLLSPNQKYNYEYIGDNKIKILLPEKEVEMEDDGEYFSYHHHVNVIPSTNILVEGEIAQGDAGYMGWGKQHILKFVKNELPVILDIHITGRRYGYPHYYIIKILGVDRVVLSTPEEEELL